MQKNTKEMQEEQKAWRKEKEADFDKSTSELSEKINQSAG